MKRWQIVTNGCITFPRFSDKSDFSLFEGNKCAKLFAYFKKFYYLCMQNRCYVRI